MKRREELVFFDPQNKRSIINLVPPEMAQRIRQLRNSEDGHLLGFTERKLRLELARRGKPLCANDERLRLQFWLEYERIQDDHDNKKKFDMSYVVGRIIGKEQFYTDYITDNCQLAWLLCPPVNYAQAIEQALLVSTNKIIEVIEEVSAKEMYGSANQMNWLLRANKELHERHFGIQKRAYQRKENDSEAEEVPTPVLTPEELVLQKRAQIEALKKELPREQVPNVDEV